MKIGNSWHFGMKAYALGVYGESGLVHTVVGTSANVANVTQTAEVLHGEKKTVYLDAAYTGDLHRQKKTPPTRRWWVTAKDKGHRMRPLSICRPVGPLGPP